jgi:ceramide glucosyltransferase
MIGASSIPSRLLFGLAALGTVTSTIYCGMVLTAAVRFGLRRRRERRWAATHGHEFLPPLSVLKPLHGTEEGLEQNLTSFFEQDYPNYELLFCARHATDEGLQLAARIGTRYPGVLARYITCGEPIPQYHSAKVFSLAKLNAEARYDLFITADADVRVQPSYLRELVQNLREPGLGVASCVYLGTAHPGAGLSSRLDAVGKSVEMTSGALVADMIEGTKFALGGTMVLPRESFQRVGGFEELGQFYADDYVLGSRLAQQGARVQLASHIIRLMVQDSPFRISYRNQLRWMQSTRRSRPWGHMGTGLTFAVPYGLLGLAWALWTGRPGLGLAWLGLQIANRMVQAGAILLALGETNWMEGVLLYPLRDLLGAALWINSYLDDRFYYRGAIYKLRRGGRAESTAEQAKV